MAEDKKKLMEAAEGELSEDALEGAAGGRYVSGIYVEDAQTVSIGNPEDQHEVPQFKLPNFGR